MPEIPQVAASPQPAPTPAPEPVSAPETPRSVAQQAFSFGESSAGGQAPAPSSQPSAPAGGFSAKAWLQAKGYDPSGYQSDDDVMAALIQAAQSYEESQPLINYGRQFAPYAGDFQQWLASRQQPGTQPPSGTGPAQQQPAAPQPPAPEDFVWEAPEFQEEWLSRVRRDPQTGRFIPATQYDSGLLADKVNNYYDWHARQSQHIVRDFPKLVKDALAKELADIRKQVQEQSVAASQAALSNYHTSQTQQQWLDQNADVLYAHDAQGNVMTDPGGDPLLSQVGNAMLHFVNEAQSLGINDPGAKRAYGERMIAALAAQGYFKDVPPQAAATRPIPGVPQRSNGAAATPQQAAAQKRDTFMAQAMRLEHPAQRDGTLPGPTQPEDALQNPDATAREIFAEEAARVLGPRR